MKRRKQPSPAPSDGGADISVALTGTQDQEASSDHESSSTAWQDERLAQGSIGKMTSLAGGKENEVSSDDDDEEFIATQQAASNRKTLNKPKSSKKSGGFQSLGLSVTLLKAITRKGFSVPTPIQRKTMPLILDGQDVVGMARTGSGKTAAFVIPMIEKLKAHRVQVGTRALVLSPSRELAIQSLKAVKEFGKGTDLRTQLIVGGDSLEDQFSHMTSNPDVVIATPGRFLHLLVEMSLDLSSMCYVVFDEADRLFEMGFQAQLTEILHGLPLSRQTLLFSATLPSSLVEFAQAGLKDPQLVRLDAETKISPDLESAFFTVKNEDKDGALLYILSNVIKMPQASIEKSTQPENSKKRKRESGRAIDPPTVYSTIIFAESQKQVEYLTSLLSTTGYSVSFIYGNLDQHARKFQIESFRNGNSTVLVVTDVAARGIDIPLLANVINYDFPAQPKIFVHRVGRTARAGRRGWSYNLVETADLPYLLDLQLFLGRKLVKGEDGLQPRSFAEDVVVGGLPRSQVEPSWEYVAKLLESDTDLRMLRTVAGRAKKQYTRTRSAASTESAQKAKALASAKQLQECHPIFQEKGRKPDSQQRDDLLARISGFRPVETVFEIGRRGEEHEAIEALRKQRERIHGKKQLNRESEASPIVQSAVFRSSDLPRTAIGANDLMHVGSDALENPGNFSEGEDTLLSPDELKTHASETWRDADNFISYQPRDSNVLEDKAYGVRSGSGHSNFAHAARGATMDLDDDEMSRCFGEPSRMRWDKKSKKYVSQANDQDGSKGRRMIVGESGQRLAASFRSGRFDAWKKANRIDRLARPGEKEAPSTARLSSTKHKFRHFTEKAPKQLDKYRDDYQKKKKKLREKAATNNGATASTRPAKNELRSVDDVRKQRLLKQKRREKNARPARKQKR